MCLGPAERFPGFAAGSPPQKLYLLMGSFFASESHSLGGMLDGNIADESHSLGHALDIDGLRASFVCRKLKKFFV